jgi:raffinose/stachyose/melibiose transport system permease protein
MARPRGSNSVMTAAYPHWFYLPAGIVFGVIFVAPTLLSFYYSLTRWTLFDAQFIGLDNFVQFFKEPALMSGARNSIVYAVVTSALKVILGLLLATLLTSRLHLRNLLRSIVFFPVLVSTVAVGLTFAVLMHPSNGLINRTLEVVGIDGPAWLSDPSIALLSVALVDVWKGIGLALVIFVAAIMSIPEDYFDTARLEGGAWVKFRHVILPLSRNATFTVILLSFIGGLRSFDLIWTMTHGGPGFASDVIASTIFKQYQAGFYGLATAGNVILFIAVTLLVFPMMRFFNRHEVEL